MLWFQKKKGRFPRFLSFQLGPIPKIENSEISGRFLLLKILVTQDLKTKKMN